jgi:hypothetical protein
MNLEELRLHFSRVRKMQTYVKDLEDRITNDNSDDAITLKNSYSRVKTELRYLLSKHYNAEVE